MQRVLFSFFDLLFVRNAYAYGTMPAHLTKVMPGHNFYFPRLSPLHDQPHPLLAYDDMREHALGWLAMLWDRFAEYFDEEVLPAFERGENVVLDGCVFDALLTLSIVAWDRREEFAAYHRERVQAVFTTRGIPTPVYFLMIRDADAEFERFQSLHSRAPVSRELFLDFYNKAEVIRTKYFANEGELTPIRVPAFGELSDFGIQTVITKHLRGTTMPLTQAA